VHGRPPSPETAALAHEDREALVAALNRLPPPDREVIGYRFLVGLSESETADVLGVRQGTAKSRLSRAMARLRATLEDPA
jgi:RNA polymerase sigma factor (sigma-70 family)